MSRTTKLLTIASIIALGAAATIGAATSGAAAAPAQQSLRFRITLSPNAARTIADLGLETPVTGRAYVIISRNDQRQPRQQAGLNGVPLWGMDVSDLGPGDSVIIDSNDAAVIGYPLDSFSEVPDGSYFVQAFLNIYTTFERSDGHVLQMHLNSGAGQSAFRAPGNAHSAVEQVTFSTRSPRLVDLTITDVIPPAQPLGAGDVLQQGNPPDSEHVKYVKIRSEVVNSGATTCTSAPTCCCRRATTTTPAPTTRRCTRRGTFRAVARRSASASRDPVVDAAGAGAPPAPLTSGCRTRRRR